MRAEIEEVDARTAREGLLREMHEYYVELDARALPGDPPAPFERRVADWRRIRSDEAISRWILREGGEIVASAVTWVDLEQNLENGFGWVYVRPDRRGRGHARRLGGLLFDRLVEHGRTRFNTFVWEGDPSEEVLVRAGLEPAYRERRSRLVVAEIEPGLMRSWIERAGERAADYELLELEAPLPDAAVEPYCELQFQMNTAPREGLQSDDQVLTPEKWREQEEQVAASFHDLFTSVAVHRGTGEFVGSTSIQTDRLQPEQAWQWETVVHPDHRNRGLGRLLKASMIERVLADRPRVERIDTFNAGSNEPMLNINRAMGYRPILTTITYQGGTDSARRRLGI